MEPTEAQSIVADIRTLHELMTPADVIARKFHLPTKLVHHVLRTAAVAVAMDIVSDAS